MKKCLENKPVINYSEIIPSFDKIFTGSYFPDFNLIESMKEISAIYENHNQKMKNEESNSQNSKNTLVSPLEITGSESYYVNDPK
jgi:hypothetical protein